VVQARGADGREARSGGWGWLIGDDGSAAWLAREAAREVMRRSDAGEPPDALSEAMLEAGEARDTAELVGRLHEKTEPRQWAALAHVVFDAAEEDAGAESLVERAADGLAELVAVVRKRLSLDGPVVLAGGQLLNQPRLEAAVRKRLGAATRLEEPPVAGAIRLAELSLG
jgi:N-acetylglucosamine kinase-like BadF-type ATPase